MMRKLSILCCIHWLNPQSFAVCRISKIEAAGDAACKAKQFVERRSMIADFRAKTATDDESYPLFVVTQT
jgi:hypothetical protein